MQDPTFNMHQEDDSLSSELLLVLRALEPGEAPRYSGLRRDGRGVVAGTQGLVLVQGVRRLAAFLAALSKFANLSRGVTVEVHESDLGIVTLAPTDAGDLPSQMYDTVQKALAAARLSTAGARLYTGDGRVFVPYADPGAPYGYDVDGEHRQATSDERPVRIILQTEGSEPVACLESPGSWLLAPGSLLDMLLRVPLQTAAQTLPATLTLLTDRRLAGMVAGYVQRHGLAYAVRFLSWRQFSEGAHKERPYKSEVALFDIVSAADLRPVPGFVCDFLRRLPRTTLLTDALAPADLEHEPPRRILVAWGQRPQIYLPHIQDLLPERSILVLGRPPWGSGLIETPPQRTSMQELTTIEYAAPAQGVLSEKTPGRLHLTMTLEQTGPAHGPIYGLLLDEPALKHLQRMVRHLPAPLFAGARIALGDGIALVVAAEECGEIEGLPFGLSLTRAEPPSLLLPRGMRLLPTLPQDLLITALDLQAETLTVLTSSSRYDVPLAALQPLSSLLALDPARQKGRIDVRPSTLPPLDLRGLDDPDIADRSPLSSTAHTLSRQPPAESEQRNLLQRLMGPKPGSGQPTAAFEQELRRRATDLEQRGEYEIAAAFYTYVNDSKRAAACYRRLAEKA